MPDSRYTIDLFELSIQEDLKSLKDQTADNDAAAAEAIQQKFDRFFAKSVKTETECLALVEAYHRLKKLYPPLKPLDASYACQVSQPPPSQTLPPIPSFHPGDTDYSILTFK